MLLKTSKIEKIFLMSLSFSIFLTSCNTRFNGLDDKTSTLNSEDDSYKSKNVINGQIVVRFNQNMDNSSLLGFATANNLKMLKYVKRINTAVFKTSINKSVSNLIDELKATSSIIEYAEENYKLTTSYTVNDPKAREQNGMAVANLPKAWDITFGDPKVVIAVIDTGIDLTHPDLKNKVVQGYNILTQGQSQPMDDNGHGTHASGIVAAETNNKIGVAGTAPLCKIMPIKALDAKGSGETVNIAYGIIWAVDHGARIISMSLGGPQNETVKRAVEYALAKDTVLVAAMGNDGKNVKSFPAALPGVISVGSVTFSKQRSDFSNFGSWISVVAPGSEILSTLPTYVSTMTEMEKNQGYDYLDGTSMACPMVAGLAGLVLSRYPNYTQQEVKAKIESTATDLGTKGFDDKYGHGLINAYKAVF